MNDAARARQLKGEEHRLTQAEADPEALSEEVEHIKGKIERLGPVNMTAIEEFSELEVEALK